MYHQMLPVQICYQFYGCLVLLALIFGVSLLLFAFLSLYGLGGTEVALTIVCSSTYILARVLISTGASSSVCCEDCRIVSSKELAINTFVLGEKEEAVSSRSSCAICLENYAIGESVSVIRRCGHRFHEECFDMWIARSRGTSCPYCRQGIEKKLSVTEPSDIQKVGVWGVFDGIFESVYGY